MYYRIKENVLFRKYNEYGYITDNSMFGYRSLNDNSIWPGEEYVSQSGAIMLDVLDKIPKDIDSIIENQRIIAGNAQFTGIAAGQGVGFTTGLLLLREGLGMRETPIRPHSWH